jgi:hypothetical protein
VAIHRPRNAGTQFRLLPSAPALRREWSAREETTIFSENDSSPRRQHDPRNKGRRRSSQLSLRRSFGLVYRVVAPASVLAAPGGGAQGPCRRSSFAALRELAGSPARKLALLLPNEVITTGMTDLACAYRAGAVDRAVDD